MECALISGAFSAHFYSDHFFMYPLSRNVVNVTLMKSFVFFSCASARRGSNLQCDVMDNKSWIIVAHLSCFLCLVLRSSFLATGLDWNDLLSPWGDVAVTRLGSTNFEAIAPPPLCCPLSSYHNTMTSSHVDPCDCPLCVQSMNMYASE